MMMKSVPSSQIECANVLMTDFSQDSIRQAYDLASAAYAAKFLQELDNKPFDRALLKEFSEAIGPSERVLDLGCGPGHTTAYLTSLGLAAVGIDISPQMIAVAQQIFPQCQFEVGDLLDLVYKPSELAGILAFYCIVHLTHEQLLPALSEMQRVLRPGGVLLLAFHAGTDVIHAENFLDTSAALTFRFFDPADIETQLRQAGFSHIDVRLRPPYDSEHPSQRCYVWAVK